MHTGRRRRRGAVGGKRRPRPWGPSETEGGRGRLCGSQRKRRGQTEEGCGWRGT